MRIGLGVFSWPPDHFWSLTYQEFVAAIEGYLERNNAGPSPDEGSEGVSRGPAKPTKEWAQGLATQFAQFDGEKVDKKTRERIKRGRNRSREAAIQA